MGLQDLNRGVEEGASASEQALNDFTHERPHIIRGQFEAARYAYQDNEAARICSFYPGVGARLLSLRLHPSQLIEWLDTALGIARKFGKRKHEAAHLGSLGTAHLALGHLSVALVLYEEALKIFRELGDRRGEASALASLGSAHFRMEEFRQAIEFYRQGLDLTRELGDRRGEIRYSQSRNCPYKGR
jgi:tetratricopeptide (TPR) repeat protein